MEKKKLDLNSIIGFVLIFGIMMWIMYQNQPSKEELAKKAKQEQAEKAKADKINNVSVSNNVANTASSIASNANPAELAKLQASLGSFAYSATLPSAKIAFTTIENEFLILKIANKGGYIAEATLKNFKKITKDSGELVSLIKDNNANLNIEFLTKENRTLNTKDLFFEPTLTKIGENQVLTMKLKAGENQFLQYVYTLKPNDYMLDFDVKSQGLVSVINGSKPANLSWNLKSYRNEKSISYENRYTDVRYEYEDDKQSSLMDGTEDIQKVNFLAFKQQFFTSILLTEKVFENVKISSSNLVKDETKDTIFTKQFSASMPLSVKNGEFDSKMNWYYGPSDYKLLKTYNKNLEDIIPLGWGIFGWINMFIFIPLFGFLSSYISYGIAIIIFTIIVKLAMSPITYKSFLSQAKMKVLRPEINELNEKFAKEPMKKQQETMKLYNKAGVNPMAGCIPALIQLPFMYASFQFFPAAIELRQKGFLWSDDLSSFDAILSWKQNIPGLSYTYGNHVSLFALLAAIAIFFYTKMTAGDQQMQAPQQEGMPDMQQIMKIMLYVSPVIMLVFFNNYGSGLSLYTLISNVITIGIMFVIKKYIVDDKKIHAQIEVNKTKEPKKMNKFQQKIQEAMEQAEAQKAKGKK